LSDLSQTNHILKLEKGIIFLHYIYIYFFSFHFLFILLTEHDWYEALVQSVLFFFVKQKGKEEEREVKDKRSEQANRQEGEGY